jgi:hypothetical protein
MVSSNCETKRMERAIAAIHAWLRTAGATQAEFAELAKISPASVTRTLDKPFSVSPEIRLKVMETSERICQASTEVIIPADPEYAPAGLGRYAAELCDGHYQAIKSVRLEAKGQPEIVFARCPRLVAGAVGGPPQFRTKMCYRTAMTILATTWLLETLDVSQDTLAQVLQWLEDLRTAGLDAEALEAAQSWRADLEQIAEPEERLTALKCFDDPQHFADRLRNYSFTAECNVRRYLRNSEGFDVAWAGLKDTLTRSVEEDDGFWSNALRLTNSAMADAHRPAWDWSTQLFAIAAANPCKGLDYARRTKDVPSILAHWDELTAAKAAPTRKGRLAIAILLGCVAAGGLTHRSTGLTAEQCLATRSSNGKDRTAVIAKSESNGKDRAAVFAKSHENGKDRAVFA